MSAKSEQDRENAGDLGHGRIPGRGYLVIRVHITDPVAYEEYKRHSGPAVAQYGGRFLARGGMLETLEGPAETRRVVLIEFPDPQAARRFYLSPEYARAMECRRDAARAEFLLLEGC